MNPKSRTEAVWILVMLTSVLFEWLLIENLLIVGGTSHSSLF
jgi:hypothetical protein